MKGSLESSETVEVFGDYINTYDIRQSQEDGATVPIYYSPRKTDLHLKPGDIDKAFAMPRPRKAEENEIAEPENNCSEPARGLGFGQARS